MKGSWPVLQPTVRALSWRYCLEFLMRTQLESETRHSGTLFSACLWWPAFTQGEVTHRTASIRLQIMISRHGDWTLVKTVESWTGQRVQKFSLNRSSWFDHKGSLPYCFLWLERKWKWASCVTRWPLQNSAMASDANEKQRGRGMLGGDPFNAPRSPLPCPPRAPGMNQVSQLKMKKTLELMADC